MSQVPSHGKVQGNVFMLHHSNSNNDHFYSFQYLRKMKRGPGTGPRWSGSVCGNSSKGGEVGGMNGQICREGTSPSICYQISQGLI